MKLISVWGLRNGFIFSRHSDAWKWSVNVFIGGVECKKSEREIRTLELRYDRDVHEQGTYRERAQVKYESSWIPKTWMSYIQHVEHFKS